MFQTGLRMRQALNARLQPPYLRLLALAVLVMGCGLAVFNYSTARGGVSQTGIPWGADFAGFFVAGQILDAGETARLYDRTMHAEYYHRLLPALPKDEVIPYVHPPFVAGVMRWLTAMPYELAVWVWMLLTLGLYIAGVLLVLKHCPELQSHRWLVLLLALSFEPFLFECWLGGQLSAIGFFSFSLCYHFIKSGKPVLAGLALGLCFYKPTLLLLLLPMLIISLQWQLLLGMALTGLLYVALSLLMVGWDCTLGYLDVLLAFRQQSSGADEFVIRHWKYVDINHFYHSALGKTSAKTVAFGITTLFLFVPLAVFWWRRRRNITNQLWASTLFLIPVINLYFGIYDAILVVQAVMIVTAIVLRHNSGKLLGSDWDWCLLALALVPWFAQSLARYYGLQLMTVVLVGCAAFAALHRLTQPAASGNGESPG